MKILSNRITRIALVALCTSALAAPVFAQDAPPPPPPANGGPQGGPHGRGGDPARREDKQLEMMTKHLKLTTDQQTQIKAIQQANDDKLMALRNDTSTSRQQKGPQMRSLMEDRTTQIRAVLTDAQKPKYDEMVAKERERMQQRGGRGRGPGGPGGDGGGNPPPPPPPSGL